jgi:hypothetical protein
MAVTADGNATPKRTYTSKDLAKDIVKKKTTGRHGPYDTDWSSPPYFRGGARPPRINAPDATPSTSGGFKFNPKAKLDPSVIRDRRTGKEDSKSPVNPNQTHEPYVSQGKPPPNKSKLPRVAGPDFKWNTKDHPPPNSDIVSKTIDSRTPMQKAIEKEIRRTRNYENRVLKGKVY